ncbi:hypothetical protein BJX63DRAFT_27593 [Aspergillus granulosus]|uniref:RING-type domain-containing protein n=1 Tax=Aspergillus granulosus TaxID=176169 RepID=A0ABR4HUD9_9EURO
MDSPIYISSSSGYDDDSVFGDYYSDARDEPAAAGNAAYRPAKKQRVHGPDIDGPTDPSDALLAYLGANASQNLQNPYQIAQPADATDPLLVQILEIFPDISHTYVTELITRHKDTLAVTASDQPLDVQLALSKHAIYEEILEQRSYPKQDVEAAKRKRENSDSGEASWQNNMLHQNEPNTYSRAAAELLAKEFPLIPMSHVRKVIGEKRRAYHAFLALHTDDNLEQGQRPYTKLKKSRISSAQKLSQVICDIITIEIDAARSEIQKLEAAIRKKREEEEAERANEEECARTNNLVECGCCFSDAPANRAIPCEGSELHFFCYACIRKSAETQIGLMKYTLQCFDVSGCQASFARSDLKEVLGSSMMAKLDSLQQDDEIRMAGLEGLEDCPFCSFKAVLVPVEEDREFRCENPSCKIVSCRLCKQKTHIPMSCDEARKDKGLSERHEVEEAMSKALIRNCPKCQVKIVKEDGCNKMICPQCRTSMCYVCQKDITKEAYGHFGRGCPQSDVSAGTREQREIQQAAQATIDKLLAENSELTEEHLRVELPKKSHPRAPVAAPQPPRGLVQNVRPNIQRAPNIQHANIPGPHIHGHNPQIAAPQYVVYPALYALPPQRGTPEATAADHQALAHQVFLQHTMQARQQGMGPAPIQYPFHNAVAFPQAPVRAEPPRPHHGIVAQGYAQWNHQDFLNGPDRFQQQLMTRFPNERLDIPRMNPRPGIMGFGDDDDDIL